jgi:hypothetical protein
MEQQQKDTEKGQQPKQDRTKAALQRYARTQHNGLSAGAPAEVDAAYPL